jgi:hypothetical protein
MTEDSLRTLVQLASGGRHCQTYSAYTLTSQILHKPCRLSFVLWDVSLTNLMICLNLHCVSLANQPMQVS